MQLIQIGMAQPAQTISVREMFERMAQKEAEMIRTARQRLNAVSAGQQNNKR